jgi:hypothetical protein
VRLALYNIQGQQVKLLVDDVLEEGYRTVRMDFSGGDLPAGMYFYRMEAEGLRSGERFSQSQKLLLLQ